MSKELAIPQEVLMSKIHEIRRQKVMLDSDLAELYGVETKRLKEQVKRNLDIFPKHFMFELTTEENKSLRSHFATSKKIKGGARYLPMVFTEHGILQLTNVLKSKRARQMGIRIIEVFIKMREILLTHKDLVIAMEKIRKKVSSQDKKIELIFDYLKQFRKEQEKPRKQIGFKPKK